MFTVRSVCFLLSSILFFISSSFLHCLEVIPALTSISSRVRQNHPSSHPHFSLSRSHSPPKSVSHPHNLLFFSSFLGHKIPKSSVFPRSSSPDHLLSVLQTCSSSPTRHYRLVGLLFSSVDFEIILMDLG